MGVDAAEVGCHQAPSYNGRIFGSNSVALENRFHEAAGFRGVHVDFGVAVCVVRHFQVSVLLILFNFVFSSA